MQKTFRTYRFCSLEHKKVYLVFIGVDCFLPRAVFTFLNWCFPKIGLSLSLSPSLPFAFAPHFPSVFSSICLSPLFAFPFFFSSSLCSSSIILSPLFQTCCRPAQNTQHLRKVTISLPPSFLCPLSLSLLTSVLSFHLFSLSSFRLSSLLFSSSQCSSLIIASPIPVIGHVLRQRLGDVVVVVVVIINPLLTRFQ